MGQLVNFPTRHEPWVTKRQLSGHFGVSPRSIERWVKEGLPSIQVGPTKVRRFQLSVVEEWLRERSA